MLHEAARESDLHSSLEAAPPPLRAGGERSELCVCVCGTTLIRDHTDQGPLIPDCDQGLLLPASDRGLLLPGDNPGLLLSCPVRDTTALF